MVKEEPKNTEKLVINVSELAQMLNISRSLAYQLTRQPHFPVLQIGKRKIIPLAPLQAWIECNSSNSGNNH